MSSNVIQVETLTFRVFFFAFKDIIVDSTGHYILCRWTKTPTISLFNNSEKLVQSLLELIQQVVEGYEYVLSKSRWIRPFQSIKICDLSPPPPALKKKSWIFGRILQKKCAQNAIEVSCAKNLTSLFLNWGANRPVY